MTKNRHGGHTVADLTKANLGTFLGTKLPGILSSPEAELKSQIIDAFYEFDKELPNLNPSGGRLNSGCTVTGVLMNSTSVITINIGDSQTILIKNKSSIFKTKNHKPNNRDEAERIRNAGGFVGGRYVPRVNGILGLGTRYYKIVIF